MTRNRGLSSRSQIQLHIIPVPWSPTGTRSINMSSRYSKTIYIALYSIIQVTFVALATPYPTKSKDSIGKVSVPLARILIPSLPDRTTIIPRGRRGQKTAFEQSLSHPDLARSS